MVNIYPEALAVEDKHGRTPAEILLLLSDSNRAKRSLFELIQLYTCLFMKENRGYKTKDQERRRNYLIAVD